jgi:hypothetical protein
LAIPAVLWLGGQAFGFGKSFDKPGVPQGAHLEGPATKGTVTYTVIPGGLSTISFEGYCNKIPVSTGSIDVTQLTDAAAFSTATGKAVADSLEGWFLSTSSAVTPFLGCYNHNAIGIYITAINKSLAKTNTVWVGEATIQGVR